MRHHSLRNDEGPGADQSSSGTPSSPDTDHATTDWFDYIYYSAMVYTTVGFGDIVPKGGLRMISSTEALTGLSMITWSASFTFLQMQRIWRD